MKTMVVLMLAIFGLFVGLGFFFPQLHNHYFTIGTQTISHFWAAFVGGSAVVASFVMGLGK